MKLVGISQRVSRGFRLISSVISVESAQHLVDVLILVNRELAFPWRPETCGSLVGENAAVSTVAAESAIRAALVPEPSPTPLDWRIEQRRLQIAADESSAGE